MEGVAGNSTLNRAASHFSNWLAAGDHVVAEDAVAKPGAMFLHSAFAPIAGGGGPVGDLSRLNPGVAQRVAQFCGVTGSGCSAWVVGREDRAGEGWVLQLRSRRMISLGILLATASVVPMTRKPALWNIERVPTKAIVVSI